MANLAALRAAVFSLSAKNLRGGGLKSTPPPVRGLKSVMGSGRVGPGRAANTQIFPLNTKELAPLAALARS